MVSETPRTLTHVRGNAMELIDIILGGFVSKLNIFLEAYLDCKNIQCKIVNCWMDSENNQSLCYYKNSRKVTLCQDIFRELKGSSLFGLFAYIRNFTEAQTTT